MLANKAHLFRRAKTAASLPGRVVGVEDRITALEAHVVIKIDEMRAELAQLRSLLISQLQADTEATALAGQLLQELRDRLDGLEAVTSDLLSAPTEPPR